MKPVVYFLSILGLSIALPSALTRPDVNPHGLHLKRTDLAESQNHLPNSKIIGGDEVKPNSVPYQVALLINGTSLCGGSLISTKTVLTACHCTREASYVVVVLGAHNITSSETTQVRLTSSSIINHEGCTEFLENDVSLVLLPTPVTLSDVIQTIPLAPTTAPSYEGSSAYLTGWGVTSDQSGPSPVLRGVDLSVISNTECATSYIIIRPYNLCTSGVGVIGACHSDSGGPLIVDGVQIGVVSFGKTCLDDSPTGFSRVSSFREWINKNGEF